MVFELFQLYVQIWFKGHEQLLFLFHEYFHGSAKLYDRLPTMYGEIIVAEIMVGPRFSTWGGQVCKAEFVRPSLPKTRGLISLYEISNHLIAYFGNTLNYSEVLSHAWISSQS